MKRIWLVTTGGTIASRHVAASDEVVTGIAGAELLGTVREVPAGFTLQVDDVMGVVSCAITLPVAFALAGRINARLAEPDCAGVVVTHGTDTMEEVAYLCDLLLESDKPVVFTGAQRPGDDPDTDGPRNLTDAIGLAASPLAVGLGAVVVMDQQVLAARDVTKAHTSRVSAFVSRGHGSLGVVDGSDIVIQRRPAARRTYRVPAVESKVDLIRMVLGADDRLIRHAAASGARAIVIEGFGRGNTTPVVAEAVADIIRGGVPVLIASRCGEGRVKPVYGNAGGGKELERAGAIFGGDLSGAKLRILVAVLLGMGMPLSEIREEIAMVAG
ncbi:MAG: asparaginase [Hyphomicrobiaceae bacterium]